MIKKKKTNCTYIIMIVSFSTIITEVQFDCLLLINVYITPM